MTEPHPHDDSLGVAGAAPDAGDYSALSERVVLGTLLDGDAEFQRSALPVLTAESFTTPDTRAVFHAITTLARVGDAIDAPTVVQTLDEANLLSGVGGPAAVTRLVTESLTVAVPRVHLQRVLEATQRRQVHEVMSRMLASRATPDQVFAELDALRETGADVSVTLPEFADQVAEYQRELQRRRTMDSPLVGVPTGWKDLDGVYDPDPNRRRIGYLPGGFERKHLALVAARPGVGKTSVVIDFLRAACKSGAGVVFFSNEMPAQEIIELIVCAEVKLYKRDRYKWPEDIPPHGWDKIAEVQADITRNWHLVIDDQASTLADQRRVLAAARMKFRDEGADLDIAFQDFIQRMSTPGGRGAKAQHEELGDFSKGWKDMAKELNVAAVVAAQLNRSSVEGDRLPRADDLRGSGSLEQDADVIIGLHRPYAVGGQDSGHTADELKVVMIKVRHGAAGQVFERAFLGELAQTSEPAPRAIPVPEPPA
ncbi:replicative DNA helicase [Dietzia sp. 179-F 9C3 NHS]|uniref:replicative DNA helicase n=1 Tax=Dietzia sp. 179-F 9C3 NHS TaxID=3374295 RepID=UPI0038792EB3